MAKVIVALLLFVSIASVCLAEEITYTFKGEDWANLVKACEAQVQEKTQEGKLQYTGKEAVEEAGRRLFMRLLYVYEVNKAREAVTDTVSYKNDAISVKKAE